MAAQGYPHEIRAADLDEDSKAVHRQLCLVAELYPHRAREFAAAVCRAVGNLHCTCDGEPQPLEATKNHDQRREAARAHPGTCGVAMADVIAAVETEEVVQTADRKQRQATYTTFRNQACYDAAKALNAYGGGVQVTRNTCFAKACQALWPGDDPVHEFIAAAFSSENVASSDVEEESQGQEAADQEEGADAEGEP